MITFAVIQNSMGERALFRSTRSIPLTYSARDFLQFKLEVEVGHRIQVSPVIPKSGSGWFKLLRNGGFDGLSFYQMHDAFEIEVCNRELRRFFKRVPRALYVRKVT